MLTCDIFKRDELPPKYHPVTEEQITIIEASCAGGKTRVEGGLGWKKMNAERCLIDACQSSTLASSLHKAHNILTHYSTWLGHETVNTLKSTIPVLITARENAETELQALISSSDACTLGELMKKIGLQNHPFVKKVCTLTYRERLQDQIRSAEGQVTDPHLDYILSSTEAVYTALIHPLMCSDKVKWLAEATDYIYEEFGKMRCDEFFDILVEYPDSMPALVDLRSCFVAKPSLYAYLVTSAKDVVKKRLLHAGAKTDDIVQLYIDAMKAVDMLFPGQHKAIDAVTGPIQSYLRNRREAATLFVFGLIDDHTSQLSEILQPELHAKRSELCDVEEEEVVDDDRGQQRHIRRLDVLKRLVNTFGGRDFVVSLYRSVLADKLMAREDFNAEAEITALELLKVRFGDTPLQNCEVMVRDVAESKRFCQMVHKKGEFAEIPEYRNIQCEAKMATALIQSKLYWPKLPVVQEFTPHPLIATLQDALAADYGKRKEPRKIRYQPGVGSVSLTVSLYSDSSMTEKVSLAVHAPIPQVSILLHLGEAQPQGLGLDELAELCTVAPSVVASKISYWVNQSLVVLENGVYTCAVTKTKGSGIVEGDANGADEIMAAEDEEANETIAEFVDGILRTFGPQDVPFIENKLQAFMDEYTKCREGLVALLSGMVTTDQLHLSGDKYSVKD
eukprot:TRINITY_DN19280_c0_g1_i1.p1 TRINITY_DN19280_c0_g1~~TRINITY_DN19280_c0_g1_i1.p1  ORF type:complete len:677 (+),score=142.92 TRINITY_DN19280_c0_g1_i1:55-2085(+)